ncbi:hypothetical protein SERLA73DRAFT_116094 [Serpula lacrymans var. lacrymans S7.3]|uniref:Inositol polyphosphate-related phosphatase domain-containing protein n=2 Tax=Serpula lacrymans var. lacrymans TaxID=341189 RepID=F8QEN1_SERL3|nr:uncharacterized protein SERLADRAFT_418852 [Serpula lacrymans var. lacrymans S7.9]EGN93287.1 hypothetical protein SERLA73DRAFT_116094 [Serpula lacrymans var. lacrymans S7.3]EGO18666.1 hypothetical protein SERLADRAFT_418852 [Serpula lacrymans var. lacrymans S7.9]
MATTNERLLVQIGSYNTNLQGGAGVPQDLVDWLAPTLQVSSFLSRQTRAPDIVAVGFQELLPLHLGFSGLSNTVLNHRAEHIRSQIEAHAPNKERYSLVAKVVNVGVALLVYARDDSVARHVCDVQTQWTGCGPAYMGNKGGVGIRFRVKPEGNMAGETFTFVCAHLAAHEPKLAQRVADYNHIVKTLLFPALPTSGLTGPTTMYSTSHLFFLGDLNFRVSIPPSHPLIASTKRDEAVAYMKTQTLRAELKEYDQLLVERRKGRVFIGLKEAEFWSFQCTYKYQLGEVDKYSTKRTPSWTDRIMFATHTDSPDTPEKSNITSLLYTSIPSYTTSDHKPVASLLLLPSPSLPAPTVPLLRLPSTFTPTPDPLATLKRFTGRTLDRIVGYVWWFLVLVGAGSAIIGAFNFLLGFGAWSWYRSSSDTPASSPVV